MRPALASLALVVGSLPAGALDPVPASAAPLKPIAPAPVVVQPAPQPQPRFRWQRLWLTNDRSAYEDNGFLLEPRLRDARYLPGRTILPGEGPGARETLFVLPAYRHGYLRLSPIR